MLHYLVSCYIPQTPTNSASYFRKLQLGSPRSLASAVALLLLGFRAALGGWLQGNRGPLNPVDELGTRLMYPPTSWIYDNFLLDDIKWCPPPNSTAHVQPGLTWGGWCLSWKQWTNGVESCKVVVLKSNCVESSLSWCTSHHFTYQNQSVMLKTHLPCAIGVRRFEFCGLINVFFLRGNLQLFPGLFPWNLQLSSRFFLKPLQWSLHPHICPLYPHYIPIASTKTHHFPPKKKRFPGGRAFGSFGADVSRASRVALEGSRCMDGSVANMYVAKGYAEGSRTGPFRRHFPWEIHQWGIRITWVKQCHKPPMTSYDGEW